MKHASGLQETRQVKQALHAKMLRDFGVVADDTLTDDDPMIPRSLRCDRLRGVVREFFVSLSLVDRARPQCALICSSQLLAGLS